MCSISHRLRDIRKKTEKCKKIDLENESQGQREEEWNLRHSTRIARIHIGEFFRILATCKHSFMQNVTLTHGRTQTHTLRETGLMTIGKIYRADFPKKKINREG